MIKDKIFSKEVKDYASVIHRLTCHAEHTEQCGWFYGEPQRFYDYEDAEKMLPQLKETVTIEQLSKLADILRPATKNW